MYDLVDTLGNCLYLYIWLILHKWHIVLLLELVIIFNLIIMKVVLDKTIINKNTCILKVKTDDKILVESQLTQNVCPSNVSTCQERQV